jgi:dihydrofolate reductase
MFSLCVAMDKRNLIGCNNALPWHLPADLKHFRAITMGKPIIMGRKTYESIGHPLSGRLNIVLSKDPKLSLVGCQVLHNLDELLTFTQDYKESVVIGGRSIYKLLLPMVQRLYVTWVDGEFEGDCYFPNYQPHKWQEIEKQDFPANTLNPYPYSFTVLTRYETD